MVRALRALPKAANRDSTSELPEAEGRLDFHSPEADVYKRQGAEWREMLEALVEFDRDLREHMYKEDKALFPRALDAQGGARARAAGPCH